jgi:hypothetical protein
MYAEWNSEEPSLTFFRAQTKSFSNDAASSSLSLFFPVLPQNSLQPWLHLE